MPKGAEVNKLLHLSAATSQADGDASQVTCCWVVIKVWSGLSLRLLESVFPSQLEVILRPSVADSFSCAAVKKSLLQMQVLIRNINMVDNKICRYVCG